MVLTAAELGKVLKNTKIFDGVLKKVKVLSVGGGKCTAELKIEEEHTNIMGGLHGGLSATLVDCISSYALTTHQFGAVPHVSVNMNLEYLSGAKLGDEIQIIANTVKVGRRMAFLEVAINDKNSGSILVKGTHIKYIMQQAS